VAGTERVLAALTDRGYAGATMPRANHRMMKPPTCPVHDRPVTVTVSLCWTHYVRMCPVCAERALDHHFAGDAAFARMFDAILDEVFARPILWSLLGAKRTWLGHSVIDAIDPSRTLSLLSVKASSVPFLTHRPVVKW
jgi:hypothetical protein